MWDSLAIRIFRELRTTCLFMLNEFENKEKKNSINVLSAFTNTRKSKCKWTPHKKVSKFSYSFKDSTTW